MPPWLVPTAILYLVLAIARFRWALFVLIAFLPTYLIRFKLGALPSTWLEVMIWIVVVVWVIRNKKTWRHNNITLKNSVTQNWPLSLGIILLLIAGAISTFIAPDLRAAAGLWKAYIIEPIALFIVFLTTFKKEDAPKIIFALSLTVLATSAFAIYQKFTGWGIPNPYWAAEETRRVTSVWGFPNAIGLFLAPLIPLFVWEATKRRRMTMLYYLLVTLLSLLAIIFAKSTGALVGLTAALVITGVLYKKTRITTIAVAALGALLIMLIPALKPVQQELLMQDYSGRIRRDMWAESVELLSEHPILGTGLSSYREVIHRYRIDKWIEIFEYPHNIILNFWIELGVLGVLAFVLIFYWIFKTARHPALLAAFTIILVHGLVDVPYFKNDLAIQFWLLAALCYNTLTYER